MKLLLKYSLLFLGLVLTTSLFAQKKWTLEECITYAIQNNIQIKRSQLTTESSAKSYQQGYFDFAPNVTGTLYHEYSNGSQFNQYLTKFVNVENQGGSVSVNADIDVFKGLSNWNNLFRLKYELLSQKENAEILKNSITLNIVTAYLQILYDNENLSFTTEQYDNLKLQLTRVEKQVELGNKSSGELLDIKSQAINQKANLTSANSKLKLSYLELGQLLDLDSISNFQVDISSLQLDKELTATNFDNIYSEITANRPELRKADYDVKSARKNLNAAYGALSPRISLGYAIGSGYDRTAWYKKITATDTVIVQYPEYTYKDQLKDYVSSRVFVRVQIPIFQKFTNVNRISKAKIDLLDAKYAQEEVEKKLYKDIQQAYSDAFTAYDRYLALQESVNSYNELFNLTREKFDLGMVNAVEYGIARNNLIKAQGDLLHAKYSYILKGKILDFYRGIPITL
jgi:outer membrane protein